MTASKASEPTPVMESPNMFLSGLGGNEVLPTTFYTYANRLHAAYLAAEVRAAEAENLLSLCGKANEAYVLKAEAAELDAGRWYESASPYATPEALKEALKDAGRYRWLRDQEHGFRSFNGGEDLDRQIDALRRSAP